MVGLLGANYTLVIHMCQVAAVTFWVEINPLIVDFPLIFSKNKLIIDYFSRYFFITCN